MTKRTPTQEKPWMQFFSEEARAAELPKESMYQHMERINRDHRDSIATHYFKNQITYGELLDSIEQTAAAFAELGVKKGDIVTFCAITTPELVAAIYALNKLGAAAMVIDPRYTAPVILDFIRNAKSRLLVTFTVTAPAAELVEQADVDHIVTFTPADSRSRQIAIAAAPAPFIATRISPMSFPTTFSAFVRPASVMTAVPCWSSWKIGMSHFSFSFASISKHRGAAMSSRLIPPNEPDISQTAFTNSSTSCVRMQRGNASTSPKLLNSTHFPSMTGMPASGPMSPRPSTALPSVITAHRLCRRVSS